MLDELRRVLPVVHRPAPRDANRYTAGAPRVRGALHELAEDIRTAELRHPTMVQAVAHALSRGIAPDDIRDALLPAYLDACPGEERARARGFETALRGAVDKGFYADLPALRSELNAARWSRW